MAPFNNAQELGIPFITTKFYFSLLLPLTMCSYNVIFIINIVINGSHNLVEN